MGFLHALRIVDVLSVISKFFFFNSGASSLEDRRPKKRNVRGPLRRSKIEDQKTNVFVLGAECGLALPASKIVVFLKIVQRKLPVFDIAAYFNFSGVLLKSFWLKLAIYRPDNHS